MKKQLRRVLVLLLAFTMCFGSAVTLFAADAEVTCPGTGAVHTKDNCKYTEESVVEPNCGVAGYTIYHCDVCGDHFVDDLKDAVGEHVWVVVPQVDPKCGTPGVLAHEKCDVCGKVRYTGNNSAITEKEYDSEEKAKANWPIPATTKHVWSDWAETSDKDSKGNVTATYMKRTCTNEGCETVQTCGKVDKEESEIEIKNDTVHAYEVVSIDKEPDNKNKTPGEATAACKICGDEKPVVIPFDHKCEDYAVKTSKKDAKCDEEGYKADFWTCGAEGCGKVYGVITDGKVSAEWTEKQIEENKIKEHPKAQESTVTATCTKVGSTVKVCPDCGKIIADDDKYVAMLGHEWLTYGDITDGKDVFYKKDSTTNHETVELVAKGAVPTNEGMTLVHAAEDVIENYASDEYTDTDKITKYCLRVGKGSEHTETKEISTSLTVYDAEGRTLTITVAEKYKATVAEVTIAGEGHTYKELTIPENCGHGVITAYYCTNENCSATKTNKLTIGGKTYYTDKAEEYRFVECEEKKASVADMKVTDKEKTHVIDPEKKAANSAEGKSKCVTVYNEVTKATCTEDGKIEGTCYCGEKWTGSGEEKVADANKLDKVVITKLGHDFSEYKENEAPTCMKAGTYKCSRCNAEAVAPKLTYTEVKDVLTETEHKKKIEEEGHKAVEEGGSTEKVVVVKTCTTDEVKEFTCADCGKSWKYVSDEAEGHKEPETFDKESPDGKQVEAAAAGEHYEYIADKAEIAATNTTDAVSAQKKGDWIEDKETLEGLKGKTAAELKAMNIQLVLGKTAAYFCTECGEFIASKTTEFGGHTVTKQRAQAAVAVVHNETTQTNGIKDGWYKCEVCDAIILEDGTDAVIKIEHTIKTMTKHAKVEATCETAGTDEYYECEDCGKLFTYTAATKKAAEKYEETNAASLIIEAKGHSYDDIDITHEADHKTDCTKASYKLKYCKTCKSYRMVDYVAATAHDSKGEIPKKDATCTTAGYTAGKYCKACSTVNPEETDLTKNTYNNLTGFETIPATGHKDKDGNVFYACDQKGKICQNAGCKTSLYKAGVTADKDKTVANRIAFTANEKHTSEPIKIKATCTTAGAIYNKCTTCGKILSTEKVEAAFGHDMKKIGSLVEATEVSTGKDLYGCAHACCQVTNDGKVTEWKVTEERVTPKLSDLKLNISVDNAVVAGAEIVESGKVKVTVSISSRDAAIWGTNFSVKYNTEADEEDKAIEMYTFTGFKSLNDKFVIDANAVKTIPVYDEKNEKVIGYKENGEVKVVAYAENNKATNEAQEVQLVGEEELIELYFTVVGDAKYTNGADDKVTKSTAAFTIKNASASDLTASKGIQGDEKAATATIVMLADVDGTGKIDINDLSTLINISSNFDYSAAADLDKNGEVNYDDFKLLFEFLSGKKSWTQIREAAATPAAE